MSGEDEKSSWLKPLPEEFTSGMGMPSRRMMGAGLAIIVIGVFAALVWYSYMGGNDEGPVPVVRADKSVVKEKPESPGGLDVPNQDKRVFDRVASGTADKDETLGASGELPVERPGGSTAKEKAEDSTAAAIAEIPVVPTLTPETAAPKLTEEAPAAVAPTGDFLVQLGAFRKIETAEKLWLKLQKENPEILGDLVSDIMRADLGEKGIYYRLRAGWLADKPAAVQICDALKAKKKPCLVVAE